MSRLNLLLVKAGIPLAIVIALWVFALVPSEPKPVDKAAYHCPFCNARVLDAQTLYEGKLARVMINRAPLVPGHSMIIPNRHVERLEELSSEEVFEMHQLAKRVQKAFEKVYQQSDYVLCCQNGDNAGQTVYHVHFHLMPRPEKDLLAKLKLWWTMLSRPMHLINPLNAKQVREDAIALRAALNSEE